MDLKAYNIRGSNENTLHMLQTVLDYSQALESLTQRQQIPRGQSEKEGAELIAFLLPNISKMALATA